MAAIEVPVKVAFNNGASKICLEPEGGPSAQPIVNLVLSMQIPIVDLINALAEFQSKYDAEHAIAPPPLADVAPDQSPGDIAPPPLAEPWEANYQGGKHGRQIIGEDLKKGNKKGKGKVNGERSSSHRRRCGQ